MGEGLRREHAGRVIRVETRIAASLRDVWDAWAKSERVSQWYVDSATGEMGRDATVKWGFKHFDHEFELEVFEAREGIYLAFGDAESLHELEVQPVTDATQIRFAFSGPTGSDEQHEGCVSGWHHALAQLRQWLEHHAEGRRTHLIAMRPARFEYEAVEPLFTTAAGLGAWLTSNCELARDPLREWDETRLMLRDDGYLSGRVLARSPREILLEWREAQAVLAIKSFGRDSGSRMVALDFNGWALADAERPIVQALLDSAVDRLIAQL